jgi:hypothetical protein
MTIDIRRLTSFAFFLGLVVTHAPAEPAAPLAVDRSAAIDGSAANGMYTAEGYGLRELPARLIAQNVAQADLLNRERDTSESSAPFFRSRVRRAHDGGRCK